MAQQSTTLAALPEETKFDPQNPLDGSQPTGTADPGIDLFGPPKALHACVV